MPGILRSRIGHQQGNEIVEVDYDPTQITLAEMVSALKRESSFYSVMAGDTGTYEALRTELPGTEVTRAHRKAQLAESKHTLRMQFPDLYYLDLTERQAIVLNSWSYFGGEMPEVLSPDQITLRSRLKRKLSQSNPPRFRPRRDREGRKSYRQQLLQWLETP